MDTKQEEVKIAILGTGGSGNSSLRLVFKGDGFSEEIKPTDVFDSNIVKKKIEQTTYRYLLSDYQGGHLMLSGFKKSLQEVDAIIVTIDLSNGDSVQGVQDILSFLKENLSPCPPLMLAGTKADLKPAVTDKAISELTHKFQCGYTQTSAKNNENVELLFMNTFKLISPQNKVELEKQEVPNQEVPNQEVPEKKAKPNRFLKGLGISLLVTIGIFLLVAGAYLALPAAVGTFMVGVGLAITKFLSFTAMTTALSTANALGIASILGAIAATGTAAVAIVGNLIHGVFLISEGFNKKTRVYEHIKEDDKKDSFDDVIINDSNSVINQSLPVYVMLAPLNWHNNEDFNKEILSYSGCDIYLRLQGVPGAIYKLDKSNRNQLILINKSLEEGQINELSRIFPNEICQVCTYKLEPTQLKLFQHSENDESNVDGNTNMNSNPTNKNDSDENDSHFKLN